MTTTELKGTKWKFNDVVNNGVFDPAIGSNVESTTPVCTFTTVYGSYTVICKTYQATPKCYVGVRCWQDSNNIYIYGDMGGNGTPKFSQLAGNTLTFYDDWDSSVFIADAFIAWLEANATLVATDVTAITYNGATAEMKNGQTATIKCEGKKAVTDIVIVPEFSVEIAYGDIINEAHKGQTATLKCAGKKMKHDIIISTL